MKLSSKMTAFFLAVLIVLPCAVFTSSAADGWTVIDECNTSYVRFIDKDGTVHDHSKDTRSEAVDSLSGGDVTFWSGEHLYSGTGHTVTGSVACELTFIGTGFRYVLQYRGPADGYGTAVDVYIDGKYSKTVTGINGNNLTDRYTAYEVTGLADKQHTVRFLSHDGVRVFFDSFELLLGTNSEGDIEEGDVTSNSSVDADDAIYLLYHIFFENKYPVKQDCDFNKSGAVDADDAIYLLYHVFFENKYPLGNLKLTINGAASSMTVEESGGKPYISSLLHGKDECVTKKSELPLPTDFAFPVTWEFAGQADYKDGVNEGKSIKFRDCAHGLEFKYNICTNAKEEAPFLISSELKNNSGSAVRYTAGNIFAVNAHLPDSTAWMFAKESGRAESIYPQIQGGDGLYKTKMNNGANVSAWCRTYQGHNNNGFIPLVYFDMGTKGLYAALEWTAGRVNATAGENGNVAISVDMNYVHELEGVNDCGQIFKTTVKAGDTFVNPTVYIAAYDGNVDDGSNMFKNWFFKYMLPANLREDENEPLNQMDMQWGYNVSDCGIQSIKWDYGWWSNESTDKSYKTLEGSWVVRSNDYLGVFRGSGVATLREFSDLASREGVKMTLYMLLHASINADGSPNTTEGEFNTVSHPDWFTNRLIDRGMGVCADLGNVECVSYLQETMAKFMNENRIATWRSDFEPIAYYSDKANRHEGNGSDVQYWGTRGLSELLEYLIENVKGFRYECCSAGGSMKDLFIAKYASCFNVDDSANYLSLRTSFYDSSFCLHPVQIQQPCNIGSFIYGQSNMYPKYDEKYAAAVRKMGFESIMLSGIMVTGVYCDDNVRSDLTSYLEYYNEFVKPLIRNGNLYHILPRPDGTNWDGVMYVDKDTKAEAIMFLFKPSDTVSKTITVKAQGLDPDATYSVRLKDKFGVSTKTGKELMETGLSVTIDTVGSQIIRFVKK